MTEGPDRLLASGDEAGTAPEDRPFRPDVEGLRAVAILAVVLFHTGMSQAKGGFVGVDVFFVISGFVITGLLLRERRSSGGTNFPAFYARRARRILPMAVLVIVVSLIASELIVGSRYATVVASDARWCTVFLANIHYAHVLPTILAPRPPSPLVQYWSLAVEEQFYLVYPTLFALLIGVMTWGTRRVRLITGLVVVMVLSLSLSVVWTHAGRLAAYDSTLTRVWELAIGALIATTTARLEQLPRVVAGVMTWLGLVAIVVASATFTVLRPPYPGIGVAVPVLGAGLVVAGGSARPKAGAEVLLGTAPFRWMGKWSYSWYLWHIPLLLFVALHAHRAIVRQPLAVNLLVVAIALVLSAFTYAVVEQPIRHANFLVGRSEMTLLCAGALLVTCFAFTFLF